ncbi:MAG: hypothetical protein H0U77_10755 [Nocardioidaceae bacterium]|nr:hypothetical protein [Nocardioidaceae bacterium]
MSATARSRNRRLTLSVVVALVLAALVALATVAVERGTGTLDALLGSEPECTAEVGGTTVQLDSEQAAQAALISAVSVRRGLPARAASIALATAYQESKIRNLDYGDRDSLGLFQQRPSQGWGEPEQILDPLYATNRFYAALTQVDGYAALPIDEAAQEVQRSADGSAYAQHEENARALASALTGYSPAAFSCEVEEPTSSGQRPGDTGLTGNALTVRDEVRSAFGPLPDGGYAPEGVRTGHQQGSAHYDGRAVDFFFRPVSETSNRAGWALAQFLVAGAEQWSVATVIYDDRIWTAARSGEGWRDYDIGSDDPVLRHLDHVHVDVA